MDKNNIPIDKNKLREEQQLIAECIGLEGYRKLAESYGGGTIYIAKLDTFYAKVRNQRIVDDFQSGAKVKELAEKYGLTETWIMMIIWEGSS